MDSVRDQLSSARGFRRWRGSRLVVLLCIAAFAACDWVDPPILSISAANPDTDMAGPDTTIWMEFSLAVDHSKAEQATTLTEDGRNLDLRFSWNERRLTVSPVHGLKPGKTYVVRVASSVETASGINLNHEYSHEFHSSADDVRPTATISEPTDLTITDERFTAIMLTFSEAVDRASFYEAFSLSPRMEFDWQWGEGDLSVTGTPRTAYDWQRDYGIKIDNGLSDTSGNSLAEAIESSFRVGTALAKPAVASVTNLMPADDGSDSWQEGSLAIVQSTSEEGALDTNSGMEAVWGLRISFDQPVQREGLENLVSLTPSCDYRIDKGEVADTVSSIDVIPKTRLAYGASYALTVSKGLTGASGVQSTEGASWRFTVDGGATRPPVLDSLRLRLDPAAGASGGVWFTLKGDHSDDFTTLVLPLAQFPVNSPTVSFVDLQFRLASGAAFDPLSLMKSFGISASNSCLTAAILSVQTSGFTAPLPAAASGLLTARIWLRLTPATASGLVSFALAKGFKDDLGNELPEDATWAVLK